MRRKVKVETLNKKLHELTEEDLEMVSGGKTQVVDIMSHSDVDITTSLTTTDVVLDDVK